MLSMSAGECCIWSESPWEKKAEHFCFDLVSALVLNCNHTVSETLAAPCAFPEQNQASHTQKKDRLLR